MTSRSPLSRQETNALPRFMGNDNSHLHPSFSAPRATHVCFWIVFFFGFLLVFFFFFFFVSPKKLARPARVILPNGLRCSAKSASLPQRGACCRSFPTMAAPNGVYGFGRNAHKLLACC